MYTYLLDTVSEASSRVAAKIPLIFTVDAPSPDFSGPGVSALHTVANVVLAIVLSLAVIGGLAAAGCIVVGHLSRNGRMQELGIKGLIGCVSGVAVAGGIAGLINWGQGIKIV